MSRVTESRYDTPRAQRTLVVAFGVLLVATLAIYPLIWPGAPYASNDTEGYRAMAVDMADGRLDQLHFRSPGYPFELLLTGSTQAPTKALLYVGLVQHFVSIVVGAAILRRLRFSVRAIVLFGAVMSLPPFVEPAAHALTENMTEFLVVLAFGATFAWIAGGQLKYAAATGVLLAAAALARPTYQFGAVVVGLTLVAVAFATRARRMPALTAALTMIVVSAICIGSFAFYNYSLHGVFSISPGNLGYSMTTKTLRMLERLPDEYATEREILIAARDADLVRRGSSHTAEQYWPDAERELAKMTGKNRVELLTEMTKLNFIVIRRAPLEYLSEVFRAVPRYWFPTATRLSYGGSEMLHLLWAGLHFLWVGYFLLVFLLIGGATGIGLTARLRAWREGGLVERIDFNPAELSALLVALSLAGYTMFVSCVAHDGDARYREPTDLLVVFACFVGTRIWWRMSAPVADELPSINAA